MPYRIDRWRLVAALMVGVSAVVVVVVAVTVTTARISGPSPAAPTAAQTQVHQGPTRLAPPFPSPRAGAAMAYDAFRHEVVLFGGLDGGDLTTTLTDTWTFRSRRWTKRDPMTRPGPMQSAQMVYDAVTHDCLLVWSVSDGSLAVTWGWDGTTWSRLPNVPFGATEGFEAVASDPTTGHALLISALGIANGVPPLQTRTWAWDGRAWTLRHPPQPLPVANGPLTLASIGSKDGGRLSRGVLALLSDSASDTETWLWDGSTWARRALGSTPPLNLGESMAEDITAEVVALVGVGDPVNGGEGPTWVWDGTAWHQAGLAPLVVSATVLSDGGTAHALVIGDRSPDNQSDQLDEAWTFVGQEWVSDLPA